MQLTSSNNSAQFLFQDSKMPKSVFCKFYYKRIEIWGWLQIKYNTIWKYVLWLNKYRSKYGLSWTRFDHDRWSSFPFLHIIILSIEAVWNHNTNAFVDGCVQKIGSVFTFNDSWWLWISICKHISLNDKKGRFNFEI